MLCRSGQDSEQPIKFTLLSGVRFAGGERQDACLYLSNQIEYGSQLRTGRKIVFLNLLFRQTFELMAEIVNPVIVLRLADYMLPAPVIRGDGGRFAVCKNLVIVNCDSYVFTRYSLVQYRCKEVVDCFPGVEYIVGKKNPVAVPKVFRVIGPTIDSHVFALINADVGAGYNGSIENWASFSAYKFEELAHYVSYVGAPAQGYVYYIRRKAILENSFGKLQGIVSNHFVGKKFFFQGFTSLFIGGCDGSSITSPSRYTLRR